MSEPTYTDMLAHLGISSAHPGGIELTNIILQQVNLKEKMKILDVGCGTGKTASILAREYKCNVTAIDNHDTMVKKARKRFNKENLEIRLIKANCENLPFEGEQFDFIIAESVLAFTEAKLSLPALYKVLNCSGKLIAIEMTAESEITKEEKKEINTVYGIKNVLSEDEWKKLFIEIGFTSVTIFNNYDPSIAVQFIENEDDPSPFINPQLFRILEAHSELMQKYQKKLNFRVFHCQK